MDQTTCLPMFQIQKAQQVAMDRLLRRHLCQIRFQVLRAGILHLRLMYRVDRSQVSLSLTSQRQSLRLQNQHRNLSRSRNLSLSLNHLAHPLSHSQNHSSHRMCLRKVITAKRRTCVVRLIVSNSVLIWQIMRPVGAIGT